jgi:voltage-gated potassium channel
MINQENSQPRKGTLMRDSFNVLTSKFFYLLISLIIYFVAVSLLDGVGERNFFLALFFALIILSCVFNIAMSKKVISAMVLLAAVSVGCHWTINLVRPNYYLFLSYYVTNVVLLTMMTYYILYSIASHKEITADTLFGAICGYFFLGLTWSFIFIIIQTMDPVAFSRYLITPSVHATAENFFYYSFTTMTTLGYGDILPVSNIARTLSWLEAMTGQIYIAVWISQLVGLKIAQRLNTDEAKKK